MRRARRKGRYPAARDGRGSRGGLHVLTRWRDWSLAAKLGAAMLVPVSLALSLGAVLVSDEIADAANYQRTYRMTELGGALRTAIAALQDERQRVASPSNIPAGGGRFTWPADGRVDTALAVLRATVAVDTSAGDLDPVAVAVWESADRQLAGLAILRGQAGSSPTGVSAVVTGYAQLTAALLAVDRVLTTEVSDARLARAATALYDLFAAGEEVRYQQAMVLSSMRTEGLAGSEVAGLHGSQARQDSRIGDFRTVADAPEVTDYTAAVPGDALEHQRSLLNMAINAVAPMTGQPTPDPSIPFSVSTWNDANQAITSGLGGVGDRLAGIIASLATQMRQQANDAADTMAVSLLGALLLAVGVAAVIARHLLRSIRVLRRAARDVAARKLPEAVERIRAGETVNAAVRPVAVRASDEIGQLARAFDAVYAEALRLAVEQANLRANYGDLFRNLSRRSQTLVQRQLQLIEQLEHEEDDPDQLAALFKLDHLATRMRRNNDNLLVLSGGERPRGPHAPMLLVDLLRAAVSEIEQYQRVQVQPSPDVQVHGYAAADLVRLLAELLDNATSFSAPDTMVTVASQQMRGRAIVVDIVDHGIGMTDEEVASANRQLDTPEGFQGQASRRLGLFVVSTLASQHGVRARLHGGHDIPGIRVTITIPAALVVPDANELIPVPRGGAGVDHRDLRDLVGGQGVGPGQGSRARPFTVVIPVLPDATSSGVNLFEPLSGVGCATPDEPVADAAAATRKTETTPIYDDMVSAWFHDPSLDSAVADGAAAADSDGRGAAGGLPTAGAEAEPDDWRFAADEGWRAVDAVAEAQPTEYTAAGLPKRQPRARLLPGSVLGGDTMPFAALRGRDADALRGRLTDLQRGTRRGRREAGSATAEQSTTAVESGNADEFGELWESTYSEQPPADSPEPPAVTDAAGKSRSAKPTDLLRGAGAARSCGGTPAPGAGVVVVPGTTAVPGTAPPCDASALTPAHDGEGPRTGSQPTPRDDSPDEPVSTNLPSDDWQAVQRTLAEETTQHTTAGLPKRTPKARLVPGSQAAAGENVANAWDANAVRDRLTSFQRGVRQGRDNAATEHAE